MPIEAYVVFKVEYRTSLFIKLKVFRLERRSITHDYILSDIVQTVNSYVSSNFNITTPSEIINFIFNNFEDILAVEVVSDDGVGFTIYPQNDKLNE